MRKDAKIGFAIGAVLLAVLAVYSMVVPKHGKKNADKVTLVTPPQVSAPSRDPGAIDPGPSTPPAVAATDSQPAAPATAPAIAIGTPSSPVASGNSTGGNSTGLIPDAGVPTTPAKPDTAVASDAGHKPAIEVQPPAEFSSLPGGVARSETPEKPVKPSRTRHADLEVASASTSTRVYTVQSGQTLSSIASEIYGNPRFWVAIQRENKSINPNHLHVGDKINLPDINIVRPVEAPDASGMAVESPAVSHARTVATTPDDESTASSDGRTYKVKAGDNLYKIAKSELGSGRLAEELYVLNKDLIGPDKSKLKLDMVLKLPAQAAHLASSMVIP